jgi:hypothetical protein
MPPLATFVVIIVEWLLDRRRAARLPVEVFRDVCAVCGHVEDHPDAGVALARMAVHRAADHTTPTLESR